MKCKEEKPCQRCVAKGIICDYNEQEHRIAESWRGGSIDGNFSQGNASNVTTDVNRVDEMDYGPGSNERLEDWMLGNPQHGDGRVDASGIERKLPCYHLSRQNLMTL